MRLKNLKNILIGIDFFFNTRYNEQAAMKASKKLLVYALLAQLVEHLTLNQGVLGSNPRWRTKKTSTYRRSLFLVFSMKSSPATLEINSYNIYIILLSNSP